MKSYKEFARIYDELMNDIDYNQWFGYIENILNENKMIPKNVLEMACGTGNLTKYLCEKFNDITCFDMSSDMLTVAYDKLRKYKNVKILNQDMVEFNLNKKFDAILCICDSINYITEYDDLLKVFENVYHHLQENGVFIFDINSYYKLSHIIGNNTFIHDEEDVFYTWQNYFDYEESICEFYLTFFIKNSEEYIRFDEEHYEKAYKIEEIESALKNSGFNNISVFESFTFDKPYEKSERINFVVMK